MDQQSAAKTIAEDVFKDGIKTAFQVLNSNLTTAHGDAEIAAAVAKAKRGIEICQLTLTKALEISLTLPKA